MTTSRLCSEFCRVSVELRNGGHFALGRSPGWSFDFQKRVLRSTVCTFVSKECVELKTYMLKAQYDEEHPRWNLAVYPVNVQLTLLNPVQNETVAGKRSPRGESLHDVRTESARSEVVGGGNGERDGIGAWLNDPWPTHDGSVPVCFADRS